MERGMIFDIAHGSFVDGPGIRTTVFFKGCNLKCDWCHNPEGQSFQPQLLFYQNKCTGCGECLKVCPNHLEKCDLCGVCADNCPTTARQICGGYRTENDVLLEILKDKPFYQTSGGGVTFSGGECMLQLDFLKMLLKRCREAGIHTAVDTAGNVPWESFEEILPYTDLFLYDMKCYTESLHIAGTGVSNKRILENLQKLAKTHTGKMIIRVPVIPGWNADREELSKMAAFLKDIHCGKIELLPYHKLGENKYAAVGIEGNTYTVPAKEEMDAYRALFA